MPKVVQIEGVGRVQVPDDATDDEILQFADTLTKGRVASAAATAAREPGRMAGQALSGLARLGQMVGETLERHPTSFGPGGAIPSVALQDDEQLHETISRKPKTDEELDRELKESELWKTGQNVVRSTEEKFVPNPLNADRFETAVASGIGSVAALVPSALAGPAAPLVAGAAYGLSQGEDMAQEAEDAINQRVQDLTAAGRVDEAAALEREKFVRQSGAFLAGAAVGAVTEGAVGVAGRLGSIAAGQTAIGKQIAKRIGEKPLVEGAIEGFVREGVQEGLEQGGQNVAAKGLYDPERGVMDGIGTSAGAGGVVGALFGGGAGALRRSPSARAEPVATPEDRAVMPEASNALDEMIDGLAKGPIEKTATDDEAISPPLEPPPKVTAGNTETPPTPEKPESVQKQVEATADPESTKSITVVTPGETMPEIPPGMDVTETPHGTAVSNPEKITPEEVVKATSGPVVDPAPLGMGAEVPESDIAVTTAAPDGTPDVISELATQETIPAAVKAQQDAVPGGTTTVVPAQEVIDNRPSDFRFETEAVDPNGDSRKFTVTIKSDREIQLQDDGGRRYIIRLPRDIKIPSKQAIQSLFDTGVRIAYVEDPQTGSIETTLQKLSPVPAVEAPTVAPDSGNATAAAASDSPSKEGPTNTGVAPAGPRSGEETPPAGATKPTMVGEGDVFRTSSGRETSPAPRIDTTTDRKLQGSLIRMREWLKQNAIDEAKARGDNFNLTQWSALNPNNWSPADGDAVNLYLFGNTDGPGPSVRNEKAPKQKPKDTFGSSNKVFTKDDHDAALEELRKLMENMGAGIDPKLMTVAIRVGGYYIEGGIRAFPEWSAKMVEKAGEKIRPYLKSIYEAIRNWPGIDNTGMTGTDEEPSNPKQQQEELEATIVSKAREIAQGDGTPAEKYAKLVELYRNQPPLSLRTGESKTNQAYSTPAPLAYLAGLLAKLSGGKVILESTAGNGMLLVGANPKAKLVANELDPKRAARLARIFGIEPTQLDAASREFFDMASAENPDRVIINPPFGQRLKGDENERFPIFNAATGKDSTTSIDLAIALNSLEAMAPDGRAVLILGAKTGSMAANINQEGRKEGYNRPEYLDLFKRFNVTDFFTVDGAMYRKMGAGWPVDVVVIDGKKPTPPAKAGGFPRPWLEAPRVYKNWESLGELAHDTGTSSRLPGDTGSRDRGGNGNGPSGTDTGNGGLAPKPDQRGGSDRGSGPKETSEAGKQPVGNEPVPDRGPGPGGSVGEGAPREDVGRRDRGPVDQAKLTREYVSMSGNKPAGLESPANLADDQNRALAELQEQTGMSVDQYLGDRLGMSQQELYASLSGPQIDSTALAIRDIERGTALINSDQTGTGKGRTVAAIMRYAMRKGLVPVFITAKLELYSDMAGRDVPALGVTEFEPVVTNKRVKWKGPDGKERVQSLSKEDSANELGEIARTGKLPEGKHALFTSIDQLNSDFPENWSEEPKAKAKRKKNKEPRPFGPIGKAIDALADRAIIILDESHLAAGETADINHQLTKEIGGKPSILSRAAGAYFSSATFAKRPDNLGLYASRTSMKLSGFDVKTLVKIFKAGRLPLQQALTSMLARIGEFVRRQQRWDGVQFDFKTATENADREELAADTYTSFLMDLERMSKAIADIADQWEDDEGQVTADGERINVESMNFGARLFLLSSQYLTALRSRSIADEAIAALKAGEKPVISFHNTMEGPISELQEMGLPMNFNGILLRELRKVMTATIRDPSKPKDQQITKVEIQPRDLPPKALAIYNQIVRNINSTDLGDMAISPMDYVIQQIKDAGFSVGEVTGRTFQMDEEGNAKRKPKADKNPIIEEFNHNRLNALVMNGASSTGLSMHAAPDKHPGKRVMIIAQPNPDINQFMQTLGRVMRFGQVTLPRFVILKSSLAAEQRFMTMLRRKMASLNANTTSDTENNLTSGESKFDEDIFNTVGDEVVGNVMLANVELAQAFGIPLPLGEEEDSGEPGSYASRVTGRFVMLPNADAKRLWNTISRAYADKIRALDDAGENPLKATVEDLRAKTIESTDFVAGNGKTPFDGPAKLELVSVNNTKKPPTFDEAEAEALENKAGLRQKIQDWMEKSRAAERERLRVATEKQSTDKQIELIKDAFQKTRNAVAQAFDVIGNAYEIEFGYVGIPTDIRLASDDTSDFTSPSAHYVEVRRNMARSRMSVPLTQLADRVKLDTQADSPQWSESSENATTRYIVTGNLLRGYGEAIKASQGTAKPRVVIYTNEAGERSTGVLMAPGWVPGAQQESAVKVIGTDQEFLEAIDKNERLSGDGVVVHNGQVRVNASNAFKRVWNGWPFAQAIQRGSDFVLTPHPSNWPSIFQYLQSKGVQLKTDPIVAALEKAIKATDPRGKVFDFVAGVSYALANTALRIAKAIYVNTRDMVAAVNAALQHIRDETPDGFDEQAARDRIEQMLRADQSVIPPGPAAGQRTKMSEGRFNGPIQADSRAQWNQLAQEWISQFGNDVQLAFEKATSPIEGLDPALKQFVLSDLLTRTEPMISSRNPVDMMRGLRLQEQIAGYLRDSGAQEFGKVGAARAQALQQIDWMMPVLALRGMVASAQERLPFPEFTADAVRKWLQAAGRRAVNEMRASMKKADNVVSRELRREVRDMGATWRKIIESSEAVQGDFRRALYAAVFAHPELEGISPEGATEVVNILADEWERQRLKIFRQEFRKEVKLPGVRERVIDKLEEAIPDIVRQANIGLLDNAAFRNAVAPKFGVARFDGETARVVNKLAQEAQAAPAGVVRNRLLSQMVDAIRRADSIRGAEVFRDYWYAAMLSGIRTQVDNGLSILNGTLTTALAVAKRPKAAKLVTTEYMQGLTAAAQDFVPILKGERWRLHNIDTERPATALESLLKSQSPVAKVIGSMAFVSRLINALDHLNSLSTRQAMIAWGLHRMDPEQANALLSVSRDDIDSARERAIQEGTPKNLLPNRVREILEERIPPEVVLSATDLGRQASYQNTPTGLLGHFYQFITKLDDMPFLGKFTRILSGTAFARYAINYTNDILNYVAPVGLTRWYLSAPGVGKVEMTPESRDLILAKAAFGTLLAAAAAAVFLGDDDDDEKKRALDITGSFRSLPTTKKNQLLSEGRQPYSIRLGDTYVSYRQLPVAGILGTIGEMRDRQLFDRERWKQDGVGAQLANGAIAGMFIVRDSSSLVGLTDLLGFANAYKVDTEEILEKSIPKYVARLGGSLIPNMVKELDAWGDPSIYRPNSGWEYFLANVPWARRTLEGGPARNVFGDPVKVERLPWSRWIRSRDTSPEWETVGTLASRGVFLPMPGEFKITDADGTRRKATPAEVNRYQKEVGEEYRAYIQDEGAALLQMPPDEAKERIDEDTKAMRRDVRDRF